MVSSVGADLSESCRTAMMPCATSWGGICVDWSMAWPAVLKISVAVLPGLTFRMRMPC